MANCEKDVYGEVRESVRSQLGGRTQKLSDRVIGGIPDLYTATHKFGGVWIECKFQLIPKTPGWPLTVDLSQLQRNWIRTEQESGGEAGWLLCVKVNSREWRYYAGRDPNVTKVDQAANHVVRKTGEPLQIIPILKMIHS